MPGADDHNKNFSFIMDKNGRWRLSPAYDVMFGRLCRKPEGDNREGSECRHKEAVILELASGVYIYL